MTLSVAWCEPEITHFPGRSGASLEMFLAYYESTHVNLDWGPVSRLTCNVNSSCYHT